MSRQDRQGVRTPADLERKYNLAGMQRAFEQTENSITRINQILQDYVNTIVGTLDNFEGLTDGHIVTYFYSGIPSLETEPTLSWENYEEHINDLYYDRESGKVYNFSMTSENNYEWVEVIDKKKVNVLALANATVDAKDNNRRLFIEQPIPPYDNGDLWLKDGVIYACQISKPETEAYEEHDFIVSSNYSGDTLAVKIGTELQVLRGTVLKVLQDASQMNIAIESLDDNTRSEIDFLKNSLSTLIVGANGQSKMTQDGDKWVFEIKSIEETLNANSEKVSELSDSMNGVQNDIGNTQQILQRLQEKTTYVQIGETDDGKPTIELGTDNENGFKVIITNEEILFKEGSQTPAHISNETMHVTKASVEELFSVGTLSIVKRGNRHMSIMAKGVL
jgi:hypothetical protein